MLTPALATGTDSAFVAAGAAVVGGLLTAFATRGVERMRLQSALIEKAEERKLAAIERFLLAANAWLDWLIYMGDQGWQDKLEELNARVKARDESYRQLLLLASDELNTWLRDVYSTAEYEVKRTYATQVRYGRSITDEAREARRKLSKLLREDIFDRTRPEVAALRRPVSAVGLRDRLTSAGRRR